jgi:hypothetical protein
MNFKEKFNIPENATFEQTYDIIIDGLGYEEVKKYLPVSRDEIKTALKKDESLNNIPIEKWNFAAGFISYVDKRTKTQEYKPFGTHTLCEYCHQQGIDTLSVAQLICTLKQCAKRYALEN